ncbi:glycosyltransferase [Phenylobacterium sp. LjRoot219]|uniref:glycosyltransferase n=1 Tax=Phenylobacterium sp. LjRoot219 TaxID=3342283 RepID=UPI003ED0CACB
MTAQFQTAFQATNRPHQGAPRSLELLQRFLLPRSPEGLELYARIERGEILHQEHGLRSTPYASISFDAYLNSFFEAYWVQYTSVEQAELVLHGKGRVWCTIYRDAPVAGRETVARQLVDLDLYGEAAISVQLRPSSHGHPGRLFAVLEGDAAGLRIDRIGWATFDKPLRQVSLGVGICTFNRERFLLPTLERLLGAPAEAGVDQIYVVNQGEPLSSPRLQTLRDAEPLRLRIVSQDNFGGAGGFARAALELLKRPETTHILFMDDDIEVDPAHLPTVVAFLRYSRDPLVLGGQMLDLFDRCRMTEAGARVSADNHVKSNHEQLDLCAHEALQDLAKIPLTHFNGWWFTAIPVEAFRAHGLPLPIFIRGDDMEFGVRLRSAGIPTISLPPISVWHEPFYARPGGWKHYYDLRNRLIFASLHPEHCRLDSAARLFKILLAMIVRYDYQHIAIIRHALADFLRGPELLEQPASEKHAEILRALQPLGPELLDEIDDLPAATPGPTSRAARRMRLVSSIVRALVGRPARDPAGAMCRLEPDAPHHRMRLGRAYVVAEPGGHYYARLRYSWGASWRALFATAPMILGYRLRRGKTAARWLAAYPELVRAEGWERRLGLERPPQNVIRPARDRARRSQLAPPVT